ncbi:MAG: DNA-directed RNA polymerase subunit beta [Lactococcus sp.]|uniref:DNA-directed RNA polymerase subunit beta n=1 Tax=Pseudolactococcus carnosus TaxID=2749961 RepID=UPI000811F522|nr:MULTISPECIES: DNA-directed RNA polymerase subunit beta [Lactococcus]SCA91331.1 DNA-directed RNA polymerase subunit beta [Lactococcus piscium]MCJ1988098.1 DNA-directed RNA polymerase subunit beta [Lactococcus carnosus]MCJ1996704.1 DNA-directed RNA polymerase subunit beta [Lactococcus carnosus]MCJ2002409.1 DNA-directed RNA polymerase subunit beta [Lactococcus carnosus]MCJ2004949.1 DNA-directed RNA polymerase subunit beta [Lactococcus carnosus]
MAGHDVVYGKHRTRRSFSRIKEVLDLPNLIEIQTDSYQRFLDQSLADVFKEMLPIDNFAGTKDLEFVGYEMKAPKYTIEEARAHDANYSAPLFVTFRLVDKESGELKTQEVFFGDFPIMTEMGTFIVNGAERIIVSQLVRSPGTYFHPKVDKNGVESYGHTTIPNRGAWFELDTDAKGIGYVRIDRTRKLPFTTILRALGFGSDDDIFEILGDSELTRATIEKDIHKFANDTRTEEALKDIYDRLRPGEPKTADSSRSLLTARFFDPRRYDFAPVGRYKVNKKLALKNRLLGFTLAEALVSSETGEILVDQDVELTRDVLDSIETELDNGLNTVTLYPSDDAVLTEPIEIQMVKVYSPKDPEKVVNVISNGQISPEVRHLTPADIIANVNYWLTLNDSVGRVDDIDHLGNRRIRSVGELLQNQVRIGLSRMERVIRERMSSADDENMTPQSLINIRPVTAAIKEFFGSSQLSQFMDQHNPLSELSHKRRLSALGPGGLTRDRAGYEVRDVHYTHYGRMCPIETPEGPNIGLINNLSSFGKINEYGFIMSPYRRIDRINGVVTSDIHYLTADEEDNYIVAQANSPLTDDNQFAGETVMARTRGNNIEVESDKVDFMDVSPKQVVAVATACIPFLENDDSNRALMGANMQRQAVPLIDPHAPYVGTGMEHQAAHDSGAAILSKHDGTVEFVDGAEIRIRRTTGELDKYTVTKYRRSNSGTSYNQRPLVAVGDKVAKDEIIGNGPSMEGGEMALGQNPLVAYMTWEGYNFEDAVIMSERLVKDDVYTSIAIEEYESETRDTKLGPEEITREIPNVGEESMRHLDEFGIIRIGAEVKEGDILVGKVTPKGETDPTPEERLLRAIFGEKAREVRDTSLRVPHGADGIVHDVKIFRRENGDELQTGVNILVRVFIVQKRKIHVGDKMAGRHGNKGVVSRILPVEDMPYLPDGTPVDIMLNPLGVPSRMNIGQVMELHLGMAARTLDLHIATPVFDGASDEDIWNTVKEAGMADDAKTVLYDGRTGEAFDNRVSVGVMYMIKLHHMVDDKLHARSVGPYSLVTQQPLGGKAQFGGQRFGEMEVWALEAYGAANILQEILTYKSDDVVGRTKAYEAIVKGEKIPAPGLPESFRVLVKELQSLGLDMQVLDADDNVLELRELDDDTDPHNAEKVEVTVDMLEAKEAAVAQAIEAEQTAIDIAK